MVHFRFLRACLVPFFTPCFCFRFQNPQRYMFGALISQNKLQNKESRLHFYNYNCENMLNMFSKYYKSKLKNKLKNKIMSSWLYLLICFSSSTALSPPHPHSFSILQQIFVLSLLIFIQQHTLSPYLSRSTLSRCANCCPSSLLPLQLYLSHYCSSVSAVVAAAPSPRSYCCSVSVQLLLLCLDRLDCRCSLGLFSCWYLFYFSKF